MILLKSDELERIHDSGKKVTIHFKVEFTGLDACKCLNGIAQDGLATELPLLE